MRPTWRTQTSATPASASAEIRTSPAPPLPWDIEAEFILRPSPRDGVRVTLAVVTLTEEEMTELPECELQQVHNG